MTRPLGEEIEALVAGELSDADAERVVALIASSPEAATELDDCLQMHALGHELGPAKARRGSIDAVFDDQDDVVDDQLARRRRNRTFVGFAALGLAAAAALVLYVGRDTKPAASAPDLGDRVFASLAPARQIQPRLSWAAADRYRPYDPQRAATTKPEALSFELLAEVEKTGDPSAVPAAHILTGNLAAAAAALDSAKDTADAFADRAALALVRRDPERALVAASQALAKAPEHRQAKWNRALALQALGLDRSAAAAFDAIASALEPGWRDEAKTQADALHAQRKRRDDAWARAQQLGDAMVTGGPAPLDQVAAFPGLMRLYFYDAVRSAPSAARVNDLLPLANALDGQFGGDVLHRHVAKIAAAPFDRRAALAARYTQLVAGKLDAAATKSLVADLRAAGQDDILLGALLLVGPDYQVAASDLDEYTRVAKASRDPWFELLAAEETGNVDIVKGDVSAAESVLRAATPGCEHGPLVYRCMKIWRLLANVDETMHRPAAAADALAHAREAAIQAGSITIEDGLLVLASEQALLRDDTTAHWQSLAMADLEEAERSNTACGEIEVARDAVAMSLTTRNEIRKAQELVAAAHCDAPMTLRHAFVLVQIVEPAGAAALRAKLEGLRATDLNPGERVFLDYLEGRLLLRAAHDDGTALLRQVIASPGDDPDSLRARAYSYSIMIDDAAQRQDWKVALDLLGRERGLAPAPTCVLGAAADVGNIFVARDRGGHDIGVYLTRAPGERVGEPAVPHEIVDALSACPSVDILARQPYYGRPNLLPTSITSQFRAGPTATSGATVPVVIVANIDAPAALHLAPLSPITAPAGATIVERRAATPSHVLDAIRDAGFVEIHSHGISDVGDDAALLVMSPDANGSYALTSQAIAKTKLRGHPVVVLAACGAGSAGHVFQTAYGLADAFIAAGARAVIASPDPIADASAEQFFAGVRTRVAAGTAVSQALADERNTRRDPAQRTWIDRLVVFQ